MKKLLALALSLIMVLSSFGMMTISAADEEAELYEDGNSTRLAAGTFAGMFSEATAKTSGTYIVKLLKDVAISSKLTHTGAATVVIDGDNHTMTSTWSTGFSSNFEVGANGTYSILTFRNVTIVNTNTTAQTLCGVIGLWGGKVNFENSTLKTNMTNAFINRTEYGAAEEHQINITNSVIISEGATANGGLIYATAKTDADYHIKAVNTTFITTGAEAQNMILMESNDNCTAEGSHIMEFDGCTMYFVSQRKMGVRINPTKGSASATVILKNSRVYHPFIYAKDTNCFIIRNDAHSLAKVQISNVDFYGGASIGSAVSFLTQYSDVKSNSPINGVTSIEYAQEKNADPTSKSSEVMYLPTMQAGASVRLGGETSGIRFTTNVSKAAVDYYAGKAGASGSVSYGTIAVPSASLEQYNITTSNFSGTDADTNSYSTYITPELLDILDIDYIDIPAVKGVDTDNDGNITFRAAVYGIDEYNYETDITAISYAKVTDGEGNVTYYCSPVRPSDNNRSMTDVAVAALADQATDYSAYAAQLEVYAAGNKEREN